MTIISFDFTFKIGCYCWVTLGCWLTHVSRSLNCRKWSEFDFDIFVANMLCFRYKASKALFCSFQLLGLLKTSRSHSWNGIICHGFADYNLHSSFRLKVLKMWVTLNDYITFRVVIVELLYSKSFSDHQSWWEIFKMGI